MVTPGRYRHFKGTLYRVLLVGLCSETCQHMVVYARDEEMGGTEQEWWIRPLTMFEEEVCWPDGVNRPRFVRET